jgi:hypothetical protein
MTKIVLLVVSVSFSFTMVPLRCCLVGTVGTFGTAAGTAAVRGGGVEDAAVGVTIFFFVAVDVVVVVVVVAADEVVVDDGSVDGAATTNDEEGLYGTAEAVNGLLGGVETFTAGGVGAGCGVDEGVVAAAAAAAVEFGVTTGGGRFGFGGVVLLFFFDFLEGFKGVKASWASCRAFGDTCRHSSS